MISLTLILCLVPTVQHPQSMSRRVRRPTQWNLQLQASNYEQAYTLPDDVERDKISAKVEDGILTVTMPRLAKEEKKCTKAIEVC